MSKANAHITIGVRSASGDTSVSTLAREQTKFQHDHPRCDSCRAVTAGYVKALRDIAILERALDYWIKLACKSRAFEWFREPFSRKSA